MPQSSGWLVAKKDTMPISFLGRLLYVSSSECLSIIVTEPCLIGRCGLMGVSGDIWGVVCYLIVRFFFISFSLISRQLT